MISAVCTARRLGLCTSASTPWRRRVCDRFGLASTVLAESRISRFARGRLAVADQVERGRHRAQPRTVARRAGVGGASHPRISGRAAEGEAIACRPSRYTGRRGSRAVRDVRGPGQHPADHAGRGRGRGPGCRRDGGCRAEHQASPPGSTVGELPGSAESDACASRAAARLADRPTRGLLPGSAAFRVDAEQPVRCGRRRTNGALVAGVG